jgi:hypothetical protein
MNDDGRLVGALVQGNEVILHHAPTTPGISLDCRDPRVGRRALQARDERLRRGDGCGDRSLRLILLLATLREPAQQLPPAVAPRPAFEGTPEAVVKHVMVVDADRCAGRRDGPRPRGRACSQLLCLSRSRLEP